MTWDGTVVLSFGFRLHMQLSASCYCIVAYRYLLCSKYNNASTRRHIYVLDAIREWERLSEYSSSSQIIPGGIRNVDQLEDPWF